MAIFENPQWGWEQIAHQTVDMGLEDAEVFVARKENGSDPRYFDDLRGKRLALFNGYHYAFASFNADPDYLRKTYNATLTYSHDSNLLMVQAGRADIALVTRSYLSDFLARNPASKAQLVPSQRIDQVYHHYALLRPGAPIGEQTFAALLRGLRDSGELARIFEPTASQSARAGLDPRPTASPMFSKNDSDLPVGGLAAMHQCIADHEVDQGRRHPQFLGNVLLRYPMQAVHLERIAGTLRQLVQRFGNVVQRGKVDMGGFGRGVLDNHIQAFLLAAGVLQLHRLLAVVVDRKVAHDLEQVA